MSYHLILFFIILLVLSPFRIAKHKHNHRKIQIHEHTSFFNSPVSLASDVDVVIEIYKNVFSP